MTKFPFFRRATPPPVTATESGPLSAHERQEQAIQLEISEVLRGLMVQGWKQRWVSLVAIVVPFIMWFGFGLGNGYVFYGNRWITWDVPGILVYAIGFATDSVAVACLFLIPIFEANGQAAKHRAAVSASVVLMGFSLITQFLFLTQDTLIGVHLSDPLASHVLNLARAGFMVASEWVACVLLSKSAITTAKRREIEQQVRDAAKEREEQSAALMITSTLHRLTTDTMETLGKNMEVLSTQVQALLTAQMGMMSDTFSQQLSQLQEVRNQPMTLLPESQNRQLAAPVEEPKPPNVITGKIAVVRPLADVGRVDLPGPHATNGQQPLHVPDDSAH